MNIEALLHPIADASPCGDDLSFSTEFDALQELRRSDDPTLPQGEFVIELKTADWRASAALCERVLTARSKDLRVSGWLTEAWSHVHGLAGLANGLSLVDELCKRFWDSVHPQIEDAELDMRIGTLSWLLSLVEELSGHVALLKSGNRPLGRIEVETARARPGRATDGGMAPSPDEGLNADSLAKLQRETPKGWLAANVAEAQRALQALNTLQTTLDARLGAEGPGFTSVRNAVNAAVHAAERLARESGVNEVLLSPSPTEAGHEPGAPQAARPTSIPTGPLQSRSQAIQQLRSVAEFFRRTEPHSPVAYLADKAATWGEMPLHEWLQAVVKDGPALTQLDDLLGIKRAAVAE